MMTVAVSNNLAVPKRKASESIPSPKGIGSQMRHFSPIMIRQDASAFTHAYENIDE